MAITPLLAEFQDVFQDPKKLPPHRTHDHHIKLKDEGATVNARPYRYPFIQKNEIEKMVQEMLENGIIRHNTILLLLWYF